MSKKLICCLCNKPIPTEPITGWKRGHNAEPLVNGGRCCSECNSTKVIPERMKRMGIVM